MLPWCRPLDGYDIGPTLRGELLQEEPRRFWQFNNYYPVAGVNAAMREGDLKLVFPSIHIPFASPGDQAMAETYVQLDIEYKYNPERVPAIRSDLFPERILPAPPRPELYNIREDPLELNNVAEREPRRLALMVLAVETWFREITAEGMRGVGREALCRLGFA